MATKDERNVGIDMQQAFSIIPNQILLDNRLDTKAKIVWVYIQGKPKDWDFSAARIAKQLAISEKSAKSYLIELEKVGYLVRNKQSDGRVEYFLYCPPIQEPECKNYTMGTEDVEPRCKKATVQKSHGVNFTPISNKEVLVIKNNTSNKDSEAKTSQFNSLGAEIIKAFETINPATRRMYGNKTQRAACDFLIEEYGLTEVLRVIADLLPQTNIRPRYEFPYISTPDELMKNWSKLHDAVQTKTLELQNTKNKYIVI